MYWRAYFIIFLQNVQYFIEYEMNVQLVVYWVYIYKGKGKEFEAHEIYQIYLRFMIYGTLFEKLFWITIT